MTRVFRLSTLVLLALGLIVTAAAGQNADVAKAYNDGLALLKEKKYEEAQRAFQNASRLASQASDRETSAKADRYVNALYYNIGVLKMKVGDDDAAMKAFEAGIKAEPSDYKNYKGKATLLKKQDDNQAAMEAYMKTAEVARAAGEIGEANKAVLQAEGFAAEAMEAENHDDVIRYGTMFLESSESANIHFYMAHVYNSEAKYEPALDHALKAMELEKNRSDHPKIAYEAALAYEGLAQFDKAVEFFRSAAVGPYKASAEYKIAQLSGGD